MRWDRKIVRSYDPDRDFDNHAQGQYLLHKEGVNRVAHVIAQHARNISNDMYWMEDSPPPAMEALYQDSLIL